MRVLALVPHQKGFAPGQRGSIELWDAVLAREGIQVVYAPFETDELRSVLHASGHRWSKGIEMAKAYGSRIRLLNQLDDFDAVFVYREAALLGPAFLERRIARRKPIIYQLDDPLFVPYRSPTNGLLSYLKFFGKIKEIIRMSTVVIVNSTGIRRYAEQFNRNIWQIPSIVDTSKFVYKPFVQGDKRICVGWSGSPTTARNLSMINGPLREISIRDTCDIHFIGSDKFELSGVNYTSQMWNSETEVADLRKMQVGLVPLPDHPWNPHKFIMKTAQYMSLGIVPVGTPMASNTEVIVHGENGFLADTAEEWVDCLTTLITDDKLRRKISANAARDAKTKYSLEANTTKIVEAFRAVL